MSDATSAPRSGWVRTSPAGNTAHCTGPASHRAAARGRRSPDPRNRPCGTGDPEGVHADRLRRRAQARPAAVDRRPLSGSPRQRLLLPAARPDPAMSLPAGRMRRFDGRTGRNTLRTTRAARPAQAISARLLAALQRDAEKLPHGDSRPEDCRIAVARGLPTVGERPPLPQKERPAGLRAGKPRVVGILRLARRTSQGGPAPRADRIRLPRNPRAGPYARKTRWPGSGRRLRK